MRVSFNWLRDYVELDLSPVQLADRLTMVGLEVEEVLDRYDYLKKVVVARVAEVKAHPKSDHLYICSVEAQGQTFQVVCGAPNTRAGMLSALALPGAHLPSGQNVGDTEIRGVRSTGMLCSEAELVVGIDAAGIMDLATDARIDQDLKTHLGLEDWIYEIGITPNRPDCLSVLGVAREAAAIVGRPLKYPAFLLTEETTPIEDLTSVQILAPEHCPRYSARVIRNVKIGPSPFWMVDRLAGAGVRAINNVVDITNFILMEMGQPLHSFDMDRLAGARIVVKTAAEGDRFTTLDGTERILGPETLMICDAEKPVGVGGVMGGLNSEIHDETTNVLLEGAYFNPVSIRRTSKNLGLSTEASYRFERGVDPLICVAAVDRASYLMAQLAGGVVAKGLIDVNPIKYRPSSIPFSPARCNAFLGTAFDTPAMVKSLTDIELKVTEEAELCTVEPPPFRVDLTREVDLYEEVARLMGFDQLPATLPAVRATVQQHNPSLLLRGEIRRTLQGLGLSEIITYSFISEDFCDKLGLPEDDRRRRTVRIVNPLSSDQALLRTTLAPGLLDVARRNQSFNVWDVALFEVGMNFFQVENQDLPEERIFVGGLMTGPRAQLSWHQAQEPVDFYDIKGVAEDLLDSLRVPTPVFAAGQCPAYYDPTASASILAHDQVLGWVGRVAGPVAKNFELREAAGGAAYIFELDLAAVMEARLGLPQFQSLPRFPAVERDLAVVLDRDVEAARVVDYIKSLGQSYLVGVVLFDAYEGRQVADGQRSLALRLQYRAPDRTLTDEEVNAGHAELTDQVLKHFSAALRA